MSMTSPMPLMDCIAQDKLKVVSAWEKVWREQAPPRAEVAEEPEDGGGARHLGKRKRQQPQ